MMHSIVRRVCGLLRCCSLHFHHQMGASDGDRLGVEQAQGVEDDIVVLTEEEAAAEAERLAQKRQERESMQPPPPPPSNEGPLNDDDDDSDIEMESTNEVVLPHLRMHCTQFAMPPLNQQGFPNSMESAALFCDKCYCYVCDRPAGQCTQWEMHCAATDKGPRAQEWSAQRRSIRRRIKMEQEGRERQPGTENQPPNRLSGSATLFHFYRRSTTPQPIPDPVVSARQQPVVTPNPRFGGSSHQNGGAGQQQQQQHKPNKPREDQESEEEKKRRKQQKKEEEKERRRQAEEEERKRRVEQRLQERQAYLAMVNQGSNDTTAAAATAGTGSTAATAATGMDGAAADEAAAEVAYDSWVQCEKEGCGKWRRGPAEIIDKIEGVWTCDMNTWELERAGCDKEEEPWTE